MCANVCACACVGKNGGLGGGTGAHFVLLENCLEDTMAEERARHQAFVCKFPSRAKPLFYKLINAGLSRAGLTSDNPS